MTHVIGLPIGSIYIHNCLGSLGLMAAMNDLKVLLLLLLGCNLFMQSYSLSAVEEREDYKNWLSWNHQNYKKKAVWKPGSQPNSGWFQGGGVLDDKLRKAESNKVRIVISQDGTGDFMTIGEALNSIPKPNNKRIILVINPGVYRYIMDLHNDMILSTLSINSRDFAFGFLIKSSSSP